MAVVSELQQGTSVKVLLPLARGGGRGNGQAADPARTDGMEAAACAGRILLVEADPGHLDKARNLLSRLGCQVTAVSSGLEAVKTFKQEHRSQPFDLVLLDLDLPVHPARKTAEALRRAERGQSADQVPILAMAAGSLDGQLGRFLAAGVSDFLSKPLAEATVREALERWLPVPV